MCEMSNRINKLSQSNNEARNKNPVKTKLALSLPGFLFSGGLSPAVAHEGIVLTPLNTVAYCLLRFCKCLALC